jgi:peptide/nickel transport system permease protein
VLAGLVHGARASLLVGLSAAAIGLAIGMVVGGAGRLLRRLGRYLLMRVVELFQTTPTFLLVVVIVAIGEPTMQTIALAIGTPRGPPWRGWCARSSAPCARPISSWRRAAWATQPAHHRAGDPAQCPAAGIVRRSVMIANAILTEEGISFLNMRDPNVVSWGGMIGDGRDQLRTAWFLTALPGATIAFAVLSLNLVGDGLNEILNPRSDDA